MTQIKIQDLLPLMKPGFDACLMDEYVCLSGGFDIAPFEGDWKDSLMECGK